MKNLSIDEQFFINLLICFIPSAIIWIFKFYPILLTKDSLLYLHATSAQVIAALIALSLVAYTHINSELNQKLISDASLEDAIFLTKRNAFKDLTITLLVGILSITASLLVLGSFEYTSFQDLFISVSFISLLIFTSTLMRFVHRSFFPEAIQRNNDTVLKESKTELSEFIHDSIPLTKEEQTIQNIQTDGVDSNTFGENSQINSNSLEANLGKFFIAFSSFEDKLRKTYSKYNGYVPENRNGSLRNIINSLVNNFQIIPSRLHKEILSLVSIRNSLAHASHKTNISPKEIAEYINIIHYFEEMINFDSDLDTVDTNKLYSPSTKYTVSRYPNINLDSSTQEESND